jgi:hypothetical protein
MQVCRWWPVAGSGPGGNETFFIFFITGHYLGVLLLFFWSYSTYRFEESCLSRQGQGAPKKRKQTQYLPSCLFFEIF